MEEDAAVKAIGELLGELRSRVDVAYRELDKAWENRYENQNGVSALNEAAQKLSNLTMKMLHYEDLVDRCHIRSKVESCINLRS